MRTWRGATSGRTRATAGIPRSSHSIHLVGRQTAYAEPHMLFVARTVGARAWRWRPTTTSPTRHALCRLAHPCRGHGPELRCGCCRARGRCARGDRPGHDRGAAEQPVGTGPWHLRGRRLAVCSNKPGHERPGPPVPPGPVQQALMSVPCTASAPVFRASTLTPGRPRRWRATSRPTWPRPTRPYSPPTRCTSWTWPRRCPCVPACCSGTVVSRVVVRGASTAEGPPELVPPRPLPTPVIGRAQCGGRGAGSSSGRRRRSRALRSARGHQWPCPGARAAPPRHPGRAAATQARLPKAGYEADVRAAVGRGVCATRVCGLPPPEPRGGGRRGRGRGWRRRYLSFWLRGACS